MVIVIDGPAGCGKSTVAKEVSSKIKFAYIDSGSIYRAITWYILQQNNVTDIDRILSKLKNDLKIDNKGCVIIKDKKLEQELRCDTVGSKVSIYSQDPNIRNFVNKSIRLIAKTQSIILDGRDLGTVVFPDAELKYFLSTSIEKRIHNWEKGQISKFGYVDLDKKEKVRNDLLYRDEMDKTRSIAPLKKAADAIEINGDCYTISQIIEKIICDYKEMS